MIDQSERRQFIEQAKDTFTIPRPQAGITVHLMAVLVAVGLAALFVAAYTAFDKVMPSVQAVFAATLIEAALIIEALALIRGRNKLALVGLIVSLSVSGIYNYIQVTAEAAAEGLTGWPLLIALSLGPLAALVSLSLALGDELRKHEMTVTEWQEKRQAHVQNEVNRLVKNANSRRSKHPGGRSITRSKPFKTNDQSKVERSHLPGFIIETYQSNPEASYSDLVGKTGWSKGTISSEVNKLIEQGKIERSEQGVIALNGHLNGEQNANQ